ncbi:P-loop containing nucleoside triphosphate hydrolase [Vibrio phage 1.084.O._10N.261.49.F5]|nr:P-loop containing nucleoside triphosphate hydrolase [Vibrio phage 1.084.O._10N.261.49.F5]
MIDWEKFNSILEGLPFTLNEEQYNFLTHYISQGVGHAHLSGVAGAGKSLMMSILKKYYGESIVFFGSTGVSSQNLPDGIGIGTTHAYMSLPTKPSTTFNHTKVSGKCSNLFAKSDIIKIVVIDEAYIHNSDNLDMIWRRLERFNKRSNKRKKRSIRLLLVGDSCQSVTIADRDLKVELSNRWGSHLMFRSDVWERFAFTSYVLDKVERQDDKVFKACLDVIRYNQTGRLTKCLEWLNKRVCKEYGTDKVILAATNKTVDRINFQVLSENPNPKFHFKPFVTGSFDMKDTLMRADGVTLCEGLKVMTIVNSTGGEWINGSIGYITNISTEGCYVKFNHSNKEHFVPLYTWENKEVYTESSISKDGVCINKIKERVIGQMTCIQLLPASCISISKSQGLTIKEDYVIDVENIGLYTSPKLEDFGTNFVYLALSRGVSIENVYLARPIQPDHIKCCNESIKYWFECKEKSVI